MEARHTGHLMPELFPQTPLAAIRESKRCYLRIAGRTREFVFPVSKRIAEDVYRMGKIKKEFTVWYFAKSHTAEIRAKRDVEELDLSVSLMEV